MNPRGTQVRVFSDFPAPSEAAFPARPEHANRSHQSEFFFNSGPSPFRWLIDVGFPQRPSRGFPLRGGEERQRISGVRGAKAAANLCPRAVSRGKGLRSASLARRFTAVSMPRLAGHCVMVGCQDGTASNDRFRQPFNHEFPLTATTCQQ